MRLRHGLAAALAVAAAALAARSDDKPALADGNWFLSYSPSPTAEMRLALVMVANKGGRPTLEAFETGTYGQDVKVSGLKVSGKSVALTVELYGEKMTFDGFVDPKDPKRVVGTLSDGERVYRAALTPTDKKEFLKSDRVAPVGKQPEELAELAKLKAPAFALYTKARKAEDKAEKKKLQKQGRAMLEQIEEEKGPDLYRAAIKNHPDSPYAVTSAEALLRMAGKTKAPADDVAKWAKLVEDAAKPYGPKFERYTRFRLGEMLWAQDGAEAVAAKYLSQAAADGTLPPDRRGLALSLLAVVDERLGRSEDAARARRELAELDPQIDAEYHRKVPPFAPEKYAGRKEPAANRVAVLELFTGAQCPPCVAADVAFDALLKSYAPSDVVLLQYHVHIPGPDPLANPDSIARMDFYSELFPYDPDKPEQPAVIGTPTTVFNGKPQLGGGGGMRVSEEKFGQYRKALDKLLEQSTDVKLAGEAKRTGDAVAVSVEVTGMKEPKPSAKLRLVLTEENVKYVGSNGVRFHHHVVRALVGGVDGVAVKDLKGGKHTARVDLAALRSSLAKYLDKYQSEEAPFPRPDRPLDLKGLKVVALVQDDETGEILQATQFDVGG